MTDAEQRWSRALDALAALIERQRAHVAGEAGPPLDAWVPPSDPLPAGLRPRAIVLHHETESLTALINRRLAAVPEMPVSPYA